MGDDTEQGSTVLNAVPAFERFLSQQEDPGPRETPPAQETPEPEPVETEASPEPADVEGEPAETEPTETPAETPETSSLDPSTKVKVKVDGEELEVTLEEALKGYSRTAKWTRTMQSAAAERKAFETEQAAVREERQRYATALVQLDQYLQQGAGPEPDWKALQQSMKPDEFASTYAQHQIRQEEVARLRAERDRAVAAVQKDQDAAIEAHLTAESDKLLTAIPAWKDAEKAKTEKAELVAYATELGWSEKELSSVHDHRNIVLLRKAMLWDKHQADKPNVQARIEKVRTATPGPAETRTPVSGETKALQRLAKTGKVQDAAAAFFSMLPD